jgi:dTDP-4-dehydrorhamnose reductase
VAAAGRERGVKVLVTGAEGMLARALRETLEARGHAVTALSRRELDVTDAPHVRYIVDAERPEVVVQCAAYTRVDDAEREESTALSINADGARNVARACRARDARFVYPSTDYVFDGTARSPYAPAARPAPLNAYGRSKLAGEHAAREAGDALIVRTSWLYAAHGRNFVRTMLERARAGQPLRVVDDQRGAPTVANDLATMIMLLLERGAPAGVYHATNAGETTWYELARAAFEIAGVGAELTRIESAQFPQPAKRPSYSVLDCSDTYAITGPAPHWRDALHGVIAAGATA